MSPRYAPDDIDEVRERASIVEVVGEHVRLKRAGRSYVGLCPFHQEKTPSFNVDPEKSLFYCHGCQTGGSIFTFLEQVEGLSFPEAVETLAQKYGVELREVGGGQRKQPSKRARMFALHEAAVEKYQELLAAPDAKPVRDYLASRGIDDDQVAEFKIGFGGWRRDVLLASLRRRGFRGEELSSAGLATKDARGIKDMFYGRLAFPIFDPSGRPVGFGGRVLPDEHRAHGVPDAPKYLNSRETPIFKKSKTLYGTNWARAAVVKSKRLVLVEGYTDVIALHAAGVSEAVATCGTSLTEDHMKEISSRFGDVRVVMCLDADSAGQAAMSRERTEELADTYSPGEVTGGGWLPVGRGWLPEVHVANLPEGKDPADFVRAEGAEGLQRVVEGAVPLAEFLLRRALAGADTTSPDGRTRAVRGALSVLRQVGDTLLRHEYALWVADRVGVDSYEVMRALDAAAEQPRRRATGPAPQAPVKLTGHHHVEREALRALFAFGSLMDDERLAPTEDDFTLPVHRSLFRLGAADHEQHGEIDTGRLGARVQEEELRSIISEFAVDEPTSFEVARDTVTRLKVFSLERSIVERKERLRALDPDRDAEAYDTLFEELLELEKDKRILAAGD